jgi:hypothetical protein
MRTITRGGGVDITVYLPDEIGRWAKENELGLSRMLRDAVENEKRRRGARARVAAEGFERVEVYDSRRDRDVAFQARRLGGSYESEIDAYLTPKGSIAVYTSGQELYIYDSYEEFAADEPPHDLHAEVADALGEKYVEELDI